MISCVVSTWSTMQQSLTMNNTTYSLPLHFSASFALLHVTPLARTYSMPSFRMSWKYVGYEGISERSILRYALIRASVP